MTVRTIKPTKVPGIPKPPSDVSIQLRRYLDSLSEALEIRLGRRGDVRDRAITLRELIDTGLAVDLANNPFNPNNPSNDFGNPQATNSGDVETPTAPTGVTGAGGYAVAQVYWAVLLLFAFCSSGGFRCWLGCVHRGNSTAVEEDIQVREGECTAGSSSMLNFFRARSIVPRLPIRLARLGFTLTISLAGFSC